MVKKLFFSKLFVLFTAMLILGFIIGYDYSVMTSEEYGPTSIYKPQAAEESPYMTAGDEEPEDFPREDSQADERYIKPYIRPEDTDSQE